MRKTLSVAGTIRDLWRNEAGEFAGHLLRLAPQDRACRFAMDADEAFIRAYSDRVFGLGADIHGFFVDGVLRGTAELRRIGPAAPDRAEVSLSVEAPFRNRGIGAALLGRAIMTGQKRGLASLHLNCLDHNLPMQRLVRKFDAQTRIEAGGGASGLRPMRFASATVDLEAGLRVA